MSAARSPYFVRVSLSNQQWTRFPANNADLGFTPKGWTIRLKTDGVLVEFMFDAPVEAVPPPDPDLAGELDTREGAVCEICTVMHPERRRAIYVRVADAGPFANPDPEEIEFLEPIELTLAASQSGEGEE